MTHLNGRVEKAVVLSGLVGEAFGCHGDCEGVLV